MAPAEAEAAKQEAVWREVLTKGHRIDPYVRGVMKRLPSAPRCKACFNPFHGIGGALVGLIGFKRSRKNPNLCAFCCDRLPPGGAVVDIAVLFADVRGSTALAQRLGPQAFAKLMQRYYEVATEVLVGRDAIIDKLVGDGVVALFIPGVCGAEYPRQAALAAEELLRAFGHGGQAEPWLQLAVGVHAGPAFCGNVGPSGVVDFTALGDAVNVGSRLQAEAKAGEIVMSQPIYDAVAEQHPNLAPTELGLRGRDEPVTVFRRSI